MVGRQPAAAFGALKIPRDVGWRLVDRCPKEVSLAVHWVVGPDASHRIPRFESAVIAEFKVRFSHPARIAELYNLQIGEVVRRLKRRSIRPVLVKSEIGLDFYRHDDLKPEMDWWDNRPGRSRPRGRLFSCLGPDCLEKESSGQVMLTSSGQYMLP